MIQVDHLSRRYVELLAVDDVSFGIGRGEVVGLLGHNGAGKTTIMKMLTGYLEPTAGRIVIDGLEIGRDTAAIQRRIGYLPENCPLWPEMTVIDYLDYQAALHGVPEPDRDAAVARAIGRTALAEKAAATIQTLSRGYRQRVGVAQALLHGPDIVILDEPTNGLDPTQIQHMRGLIRELATNATVLVSTHILQEVQAVCERVLIMRAGRLAVDSRIDALARTQALLVAVAADATRVLAAVPGVRGVRALGGDGALHRYRLDADEHSAPQVARALADAGVALHRLQPERQDLETVFAAVNGHVAQEAANA
ncbi:MAG TPA: ABC transporter ATP-binding protein [Burkholderiaceae bacterium]|nr:ABC transporter ATP-binding protein [Burkholderiaceae bacterium]